MCGPMEYICQYFLDGDMYSVGNGKIHFPFPHNLKLNTALFEGELVQAIFKSVS